MNQAREGGAMIPVNGRGSSTSGAPPNPPSSTGQAGPSDSTGRLRGSCEPCAKSKVKCGKEKPTCERCQLRGTECIYLISRRPGRVPGANSRRQHARARSDRDNDSSTTSTSSRHLSLSGDHAHQRSGSDSHSGVMVNLPRSPTLSATGSESTSNEADLVNSNNGSFISTPNTEDPQEFLFGASFDPNYFQLMSSLDDGMYSTLMDLEDSLGPAGSWSTDTENQNLQGGLFPTGQDAYDMSRPSVNTADLAQISPRDSPMSSAAAFDFTQMVNPNACVFEPTSTMPLAATMETTGQATPTAAISEPCDCVTQALDILKVVSRPQPYSSLRKGRSHSTGSVLTQNKHSIESTSSLLVCSACKDDRLLLMVILMIAMKLLERYTFVIASRGPGQLNASEHGQTSGDHGRYSAMEVDQMAQPLDGQEDDEPSAPRESMQSVLRELIHVQKLVSLLPARLRSLRDVPQSVGGFGLDGDRAEQGIMSFGIAVSPLSERALSLIENDVRANLKALSANIRSRLKNS